MVDQEQEKNRPLSEYNLFTGRHIAQGFSMDQAAQLWNLMAEGDYVEGEDDPWVVLSKVIAPSTPKKPPTGGFTYEKDLEKHIIGNLHQIEEGLRLYSKDGTSGQQLTLDIGRLDILAVDKNDDLVVIELKAGLANDNAIGQVSSYMGWVRKNLADGRKVRGVIIANDFTESLKFGVLEVPSLSLKKYEVSFTFTDI